MYSYAREYKYRSCILERVLTRIKLTDSQVFPRDSQPFEVEDCI